MNPVTVSEIARKKPLDALLIHAIRQRAYELYEQRGRCDGRALEDWVRAESEVLADVTSGHQTGRMS